MAAAKIQSTRDCSFVLTPPPRKDYIAQDLYVSEFPGGARIAYDVSYTHTFDLRGSPKTPKRVVEQRSEKKNKVYAAACTAQGIKFIPFVLTTHGFLHEGAAEHMREIAGIITENKIGSRTVTSLDRIHQYLSVYTLRSIADRFLNAVNISRGQHAVAPREQGECRLFVMDD